MPLHFTRSSGPLIGALLCALPIAFADGFTLDQALDRALSNSPRLEAFDWEIRAREGETLQAGLRPNPELSLEVEDIRFGSGPSLRRSGGNLAIGSERTEFALPRPNADPFTFNAFAPTVASARTWGRDTGAAPGLQEAEFTLLISQRFELGGKRAKRVRAAHLDEDLAQWDYEAARAAVIVETARRFIALLAAQAEQDLWSDLQRIAHEAADRVADQAAAGNAANIDVLRAQTLRDTVAVDAVRSAQLLQANRVALAAQWGEADLTVERIEGTILEAPALPDLAALITASDNNPDIARWQTEIARREAEQQLAQAHAVPDLTVGLGVRAQPLADSTSWDAALSRGGLDYSRSEASFDRGTDWTFVLDLKIALPLFDRNQGNIAAADSRTSKAFAEERQARLDVQGALRALHARATASRDEALTIAQTILPRVEKTYLLTQDGYEAGRYRIFDLLDAERTVVETKLDLLNSMAQYQTQLIDLQYLSGMDAATLAPASAAPKEEVNHE